VFARAGMVAETATILGTIAGGVVGSIDLSIPYLVRAALLAGAFAVGFALMHDFGFTPRTLRLKGIVGEMRKVGRAGIEFGWRAPSMRILVLGSFVTSGFFFWAWYAWPPYFLDLLGRDLVWVAGLIASLFSLAMIGGNALVGRLVRPGIQRTTVLIGASILVTVAMVVVGAIHLFWVAVPAFLLAAVVAGVLMPVRQTYLHGVIPSEQRATLVSFDALMGSVGAVGGQAGLGYLSKVRSIADGFIWGGIATGLAVPLFFLLRARGDAADVVRGEVLEETGPGLENPPSGP
jgi:MFS transporter